MLPLILASINPLRSKNVTFYSRKFTHLIDDKVSGSISGSQRAKGLYHHYGTPRPQITQRRPVRRGWHRVEDSPGDGNDVCSC